MHDEIYHIFVEDNLDQFICMLEITPMDANIREKMLCLLWGYIALNFDKPDKDIIVGSAIRKYVANMPPESMSHIAWLLDREMGQPLELEIIKSLARYFEVLTPVPSRSLTSITGNIISRLEWYIDMNYWAGKEGAIVSCGLEYLMTSMNYEPLKSLLLDLKPTSKPVFEYAINKIEEIVQKWLLKDKYPEYIQKIMVMLDEIAS